MGLMPPEPLSEVPAVESRQTSAAVDFPRQVHETAQERHMPDPIRNGSQSRANPINRRDICLNNRRKPWSMPFVVMCEKFNFQLGHVDIRRTFGLAAFTE